MVGCGRTGNLPPPAPGQEGQYECLVILFSHKKYTKHNTCQYPSLISDRRATEHLLNAVIVLRTRKENDRYRWDSGPSRSGP